MKCTDCTNLLYIDGQMKNIEGVLQDALMCHSPQSVGVLVDKAKCMLRDVELRIGGMMKK